MRGAPYKHKVGSTLRMLGQVRLRGVAQGMAGWLAECTARDMHGHALVLDARFVDAPAGVLQIHAAPGEQADWAPGRYTFDVRLYSPAGEVLTSSTGVLLLQPAMTP